jgi:hypothetical protein
LMSLTPKLRRLKCRRLRRRKPNKWRRARVMVVRAA